MEGVAVDITKQTYRAVRNYFNVLGEAGSVTKSTTEKLTALVFLEDILTGDLSRHITTTDTDLLRRFLYCLSDGCIIGHIRPNDIACNYTDNYLSSYACVSSIQESSENDTEG